jgi:hypothetical protein
MVRKKFHLSAVSAYSGLLFSLCLIGGCEQSPVVTSEVNPPETVLLRADSLVRFSVNDFEFNVDRFGQLTYGRVSNTDVICLAGLWLGAIEQGQIQGSICWDGTYPSSNYTTKWGTEDLGVYYVDPSVVATVNGPWPSDYGYPLTTEGKPKVFGDAMCWSALGPDTSYASLSLLSSPVRNVRVTEAVYGYSRYDLRTVVFIRYAITNLGSEDLQCYAGFYSDTDLGLTADNSTGYDSLRGLSYTYEMPPREGDNWATGFTALETPTNGTVQVGILSHRIMRKNNYYNPEFGEWGFTSPQQILWALEGLDNYGRPMINPLTKMPTKFAFTGDPVGSTGWLDVQGDIRSMITMGPFPLLPDQTQTVTIVWIVSQGSSLSDALKKLKIRTDYIRDQRQLWQY